MVFKNKKRKNEQIHLKSNAFKIKKNFYIHDCHPLDNTFVIK